MYYGESGLEPKKKANLPYNPELDANMRLLNRQIGGLESATMSPVEAEMARNYARRSAGDAGIEGRMAVGLENAAFNQANTMWNQNKLERLSSLLGRRHEIGLALNDREEKRRAMIMAARAAAQKKREALMGTLFGIGGAALGTAVAPGVGTSIGYGAGQMAGAGLAGGFGGGDDFSDDAYYKGY